MDSPVENKFKDQALYKIVNNMIINKSSLSKNNQKFISILEKEKNLYKFSTFDSGEYKLKLSFNQNWKLKDLKKGLLVNIENKNGYLGFKTSNGSNYMLNYENKYEIFLFFCQIIIIIYLILILILYKKKFKIFL